MKRFLSQLAWGVLVWAMLWRPGTRAQAQENWPQFRGPGGQAVAQTNWPQQFDPQRNLLWRAKLPGPGTSSPVVLGDRVFLTCYSGYGLSPADPGSMDQLRLHVVCLDVGSGQVQWSRTLKPRLPEQPYRGFITRHGYASSTPATDGQRLYVFFGQTGVFAFDLQGRQLWRVSVGTGRHSRGSAASVVMFQDLGIVNASVEDGSIVALDKRTGRRVWRSGGVRRSWATPVLVRLPGGQTELVLSMAHRVWGLDPRTGQKLWQCPGIQDYVCPTPVAHQGVVYLTGGRRSQVLAIRAGGRGTLSQQAQLWQALAGSNVPSPLYHQGHLYWVNDRGQALCVRAKDGQVVYRRRLGPGRVVVYASPVLVGQKFVVISRQGQMFVLDAQPRFRIHAQFSLNDSSIFNATPAVAQGRLFVRSNQALYCFRLQ